MLSPNIFSVTHRLGATGRNMLHWLQDNLNEVAFKMKYVVLSTKFWLFVCTPKLDVWRVLIIKPLCRVALTWYFCILWLLKKLQSVFQSLRPAFCFLFKVLHHLNWNKITIVLPGAYHILLIKSVQLRDLWQVCSFVQDVLRTPAEEVLPMSAWWAGIESGVLEQLRKTHSCHSQVMGDIP